MVFANDINRIAELKAEKASLIDDIRHTDRDDITRWNRLDAAIKEITTKIAEIEAFMTAK